VTQESDFHDIARDIREVLLLLREVVKYMKEAESEVPEKMRRFIMYMHDVHDVSYMYEERGLPTPPHVLREMERCDDRYRHLIEDGNVDLGWLERVRADMTKRAGNRWDHSRILPKQEQKNEAGTESLDERQQENGTEPEGDQPGEGG
jgi:hypothetical protein